MRVEEDSNHMTSQIIVDTSRNTVYNNTLRVRGREGGRYNVILQVSGMELSKVLQKLHFQMRKRYEVGLELSLLK